MTKTLKEAFVAGYICSEEGQQMIEARKSEADIWQNIREDYQRWLFPNGMPTEEDTTDNMHVMAAMERAISAFHAYFEDDIWLGDMPVDVDIVGYICDEHWNRVKAIRIEEVVTQNKEEEHGSIQ